MKCFTSMSVCQSTATRLEVKCYTNQKGSDKKEKRKYQFKVRAYAEEKNDSFTKAYVTETIFCNQS